MPDSEERFRKRKGGNHQIFTGIPIDLENREAIPK
jgi:hypothetical protein